MKKQYISGILCIIVLGYALRSISQNDDDLPENAHVQEAPAAIDIVQKNQAIDLINKLIKENALFAVKLAHPLLPGKVHLWQQRGLVQFPTKQIPWTSFIKDVHAFGTNLHELLARNPQTGEYYHLPKLQKDAAIYKSLQQLDQALTSYEPKIEAASSPFKLSKESLESLQKLINIYGTTFYQNKLLNQLQQLFKGFETEAKKIRTQEEKAATQAGRGKKTYEDFDIKDYDFDIADIPDISTELDFTTPSYDSDINLDFEITDDFIKSFFE